ncbi:MAG: hypothetical protein R6T93_15015 [Trueperaceae bacterium]
MASRPLTWTLLAFVALAGLASANGYYPFGDGLTWTYDSGATQVMSGPRSLDGTEVMVLTHYLDGVPVSEDYLTFGPDGVATMGTAAAGQLTLYDPPLLIYGPPPLEPGLTWSSTTRLAGIEITLNSEVVGLRGVQTPAGRFNALQIRQRTLTSTGGQTLLDLFLVPGVGIVRFVTQDGTVVDLIERNF